MSKHFYICSLEEVSAGTLDPTESLNPYCIVMRWDVLLSLLQKDHQTVEELKGWPMDSSQYNNGNCKEVFKVPSNHCDIFIVLLILMEQRKSG